MAIVIDPHHRFKPPVRSQICRLQSYTHINYIAFEPDRDDLVHPLGQAIETTSFHRSLSTPCLTFNSKVDEDSDSNPKIEIIAGQWAPRVQVLVKEVSIAMASGVDPEPVSSGLGGAYFLKARNGDIIAVAKPVNEEPLALNNPKGFMGRMLGQLGLKHLVRLGETGMRELAAYLLDHGRFAGVPPTALVKISHVAFHVNHSSVSAPQYKIASLQRFVDHECDAGELGPSGFSVSSVHRIGILDIRLLNIDRHSGNLLVTKNEHNDFSAGKQKLIPIDHGLCLPEWLEDPYFEWLHWPQASIPFSDSELEYISKLDPFNDAKVLRTELPCLSQSSIRVLVICTVFLKRAAAAGLCLGDIGEMMTRECYGHEEAMSILESICAKAKSSTISKTPNSDNSGSITEEDDDVIEKTTLIAKQPQKPKFQSARSMKGLPDETLVPLLLQRDNQNDDSEMQKHNGEMENDNYSYKTGYLTRSFTFTGSNQKNEARGISLGDMNEEEWKIFLEAFEKLLPHVFEARKSLSSMKKRSGISLRF
ncbi:hypothetical protein Nepgr_009939 [Nepenthes gracilis]|uniref:1-phosphatidylinositol 4-kinase n=1 Tax=Nepenthes gracilis TaxID=150966 RepID=A0AAD3XKU2_NEPGR|nr:hypothetical protein Nepgr_009939 [Nepenthes gracilis]